MMTRAPVMVGERGEREKGGGRGKGREGERERVNVHKAVPHGLVDQQLWPKW